MIVQRTLSSKNMTHAKAGCVLAAYLKFLPIWLLAFPGMAARVLFRDTVACADPTECERICQSPGGCSNIAYVELVLNLMPTGELTFFSVSYYLVFLNLANIYLINTVVIMCHLSSTTIS